MCASAVVPVNVAVTLGAVFTVGITKDKSGKWYASAVVPVDVVATTKWC